MRAHNMRATLIAEHTNAEAEHTNAEAEHTNAEAEHTNAEAENTNAGPRRVPGFAVRSLAFRLAGECRLEDSEHMPSA